VQVGGHRRMSRTLAGRHDGVGGLGEEERRITVVAPHLAEVGGVVAPHAEDAAHREGLAPPLDGQGDNGGRIEDIGAHGPAPYAGARRASTPRERSRHDDEEGSMTRTAPPENRGPLADLVVIEMGTLIAGPFAGQILGDFGAEVIKIEDPKTGDPMRQWGRSLPKGHSPWWPVIGRNKKSVGLDLRTPEGKEIAKALIAKADVVIENFRPGTLEKWGLSYETLAATNPKLVMARVSGFGQ